MKSKYKYLLIAIAIIGSIVMESCAGSYVSGGVGVGVDFGPGGPRVHPSLNVGVYNGGRL